MAGSCIAVSWSKRRGPFDGRAPDPPPSPGLTRDPANGHLAALARGAGADCLVAGDVGLTDLTGLVVPVCSPATFLARLHAGHGGSG